MNTGILLTGKVGVGKSEVAKLFFDELYYRYPAIISLAAPIKELAKEYFGWDGKKDTKGRRLLQVLGTEAGREYNEDIWANIAIQRFKDSTCGIMIVDDIRFLNEIECIEKSLDHIYVFNISGPRRRKFTKDSELHMSERGINNREWNGIIVNEGTLEDLYLKVKNICKVFEI